MPANGTDPHVRESHATHWTPRVGVVGCGLMVSGIAEVCARSGLDVDVFEPTVDAASSGRQHIERSLTRARRSGKIDDTEEQAARTRISFHAEFERLAGRRAAGSRSARKESK